MKITVGLVAAAVAVLTAAAGFVCSGAYDVAADAPHWPVTAAAIETLKDRSIAARARGIGVPADLGDEARARRGAGNYDAMCTGCHLRPGMDDSEIRKGLYPQPPNLSQADEQAEDSAELAAQRFWTIKHGIKLTAMPAWSKGGVDDATIWDLVALLQKMPSLSAAQYQALVASSEGHTHAGAAGGSHDHGDHHDHEH